MVPVGAEIVRSNTQISSPMKYELAYGPFNLNSFSRYYGARRQCYS